MTSKLFSELGLSPELLKAIDRLGFEQASPIQAEAIPVLMGGDDAVGQSQTGSGKTAAFGIPAVEKVDVSRREVQILILCPTRELAVQVSEEIHKLAFFKRGVHALPIYGGQSYERQFAGLKQGAQIVIGTPGRVMDHMNRGTLRLDTVRMVILDEADVMLNMGFREDMEFILQAVPSERQTVFFSATMPRTIRELIDTYSKSPKTIAIQQKALTVPTVEQTYYEIERRQKIDLLTRLIDMHDLKLGIVFCNTKRMVDDLVDHLNAMGYSADRLHGDMSQAMRDRVMQKFRKSGLEFLVATDVAARGIDVDDVEVVFNYDLPYDGEDYVHRIGRTGRKGRTGRAISFASGREVFQIRNIERYTNTRIHRGRPPSAGEVEEARTNALLDKLRQTLKSGEYKRQDHLVEVLLEEGFASTDIISALLHRFQVGDETAATAKGKPAQPLARPQDFGNESRPGRPGGDRYQDRRERYEREPRSPRADGFHGKDFAGGERRENRDRRRTSPHQAPPAPLVEHKPQPARSSAPKPAAPPAKPAEVVKPAGEPAPAPQISKQPKPSRRTAGGQTRLWMNMGALDGMTSTELLQSISGGTGLPAKVVGSIDIRDRHLFVDVNTENANSILSTLSRAEIMGRKVKIKIA
ncbi:MAG: DEAD/DEAH box helicase [Verrucomicrobia bacterium]|nr:DEAD/DEAH box helicase [Verrucomicrobiota bacterium]